MSTASRVRVDWESERPPMTILTLLFACANDIEGANPGECTDRADNDQDSYFDCADSDCWGSPDCADHNV